MNIMETYRGFRIYANCESSIITGNTPRELYHMRHLNVGGFECNIIEKEQVNFKAYTGGWNPIYADSIEKLRHKIDCLLGPPCNRCDKLKWECDCIEGAC